MTRGTSESASVAATAITGGLLVVEPIRPRATLPRRIPRATIAGMGSEHLTREHARKLAAKIERHTVYLQKMVDQMRRLRWPEDDPLWAPTLRAHAAMMNLLAYARGAGETRPAK